MPPKFAVGDRVRCLATRFDAGSADRNGDVFSVRQRALGFGEFCFGSVKWVYSSRRGEQTYRVLYDGDSTQMQSAESHLEPEGEEGAGGQVQGEGGRDEEDVSEVDIDNERACFACLTCVFFRTHLLVHPRRPPGHHQRHSRRG